jgi:hypothetical protein
MILSFVARKLAKKAVSSASKKLVKKAVTKKALSAAQKRALAKAVKASAMARKKLAAPKIGKIRAYRIKKVQARIRANDSKLKAIRKQRDTVYRMQSSKGTGFMKKRVFPPKSITSLKGKPFPVHPVQAKQIKALKKSMPEYDFEVVKFDRGDKFAFASPKQAEKYFNVKERAWYKSKGYNIDKISNVKITGRGKSQVVFKSAGNLPDTQKEAMRLAAKYKKLTKQ